MGRKLFVFPNKTFLHWLIFLPSHVLPAKEGRGSSLKSSLHAGHQPLGVEGPKRAPLRKLPCEALNKASDLIVHQGTCDRNEQRNKP